MNKIVHVGKRYESLLCKMQKAVRCCALLSALMVALFPSSADAGLKYWTSGGYDADSYVQDGLVLNYDGIRNVGLDQPHSTNTTTWVNLAKPGTQDLMKGGDGKNSKWLDDGFFFDGTNWFGNSGLTISGPRYTTQTLIDANCADQMAKGNKIGYVFFPSGTDNWKRWSVSIRTSSSDGVWFNTHDYTSDRPKIRNVASFSYLTMVANDTYTAIFNGVDEPGGEPGRYELKSGVSAIGSFTSENWAIGGVPSKSEERLIGTIKNFRHYGRLLSADELKWNRAVDDFRYFGKPVSSIPVTNAVIVSSVASVSGSEKAGSYAVDDDGYVFSAPASRIVNGRTYSCTGYTLEAWDGGAWSAPDSRDALSCSVSSSDRVRITWQWTGGDGIVTYDTGDYVQDGLVLMYDGIANVGADQPHSDSTKAWKNLAPNGGWDAMFHLSAVDSVPGEWSLDGYRFEGESYFSPGASFPMPTNQTIQAVLYGNKVDQNTDNNEAYIYYANGAFQYGGALSLRGNSTGRNFFDWATHGYGDNDSRPDCNRPLGSPFTYITAVMADDYSADFTGTVKPTGTTDRYARDAARRPLASVPQARNASDFGIGGIVGDNRLKFTGTIKNFRLYNRVLTDEELAYNRTIDDARFFGIMPVTNVVVASSHSFLSGSEPCRNYMISGSYTFSAPTGVQTDSRGFEYTLAGYTLETYDALTQCWSAPVANAGAASYTYTVGDSPAKVRLTWQWNCTKALRTAADYGIEDIVSGGLLLHYDGIRNTGPEQSDDKNVYSAASYAWVNLADPGLYTLERIDKTTRAGAWTDFGYAFTNTSSTVGGCFQYVGSFTFAPRHSLQVLMDASAGDQMNSTCGYLMINSPWTASSLALRTHDGYCYYVVDGAYPESSARPQIMNDSRRYSYGTAIMNGTTTAFFDGTEVPTSGAGFFSSATPATAQTVTSLRIGGQANGTQDFTGTLKNFRYYDRVLTADELVRNRNVDSARYFGALATTNVFVVAGGEGSIQEESGAYKVDGEWTFSATKTVDKDGAVVDVVRYSTEELVDGQWKNKTFHGGNSYTYVEGASPATVRLVWLGKPLGFMLIVE